MASITFYDVLSTSSPTQIEGTLSDGRSFYIRYRWGILQIWLYQDSPEYQRSCEQNIRNHFTYRPRDLEILVGNDLDGTMSVTEALQYLVSIV